jgi:hypothetical protein
MLTSQILFLIPARYDGRIVLQGIIAAPFLKKKNLQHLDVGDSWRWI